MKSALDEVMRQDAEKLTSDRRFIADGSERKPERTLMIEQRERLVGSDKNTCCEEAWK